MFKKKFPELKDKHFVHDSDICPEFKVWSGECIEEHCLSKQRVKEAIVKLKTNYVECESSCFDSTKEDVVEVKDLLKELGVEDE